MTDTVLITLGRLPKALELARAFKAAGWRVVIAEPFAWHVSRPSRAVSASHAVTAPNTDRYRYLDDLLAVAAKEGARLIVPVSEETMYVSGLHGRLPPGVALYAPPQDRLLELHDKLAFIRRARALGLAVPDTFPAASAEAQTLAASAPHVVKPLFSCSGKGVAVHPQARPLDLGAGTDPANFIVQRFVPGQVYSSFTVAHEGRVIVTALYRGTVMSGTVSVAFERITDRPDVETWIADFVAASCHSGFISFDLIAPDDGSVQAIECNPRMTSGAHFIESADLARAILDPADAAPVRFRAETRLQQFYPCLTETQKSMFRPAERANNLKYLCGSKDVIWQNRDPLPAILMPATSYQILGMSILEGLSFGEAATRDIEWRPPPVETNR